MNRLLLLPLLLPALAIAAPQAVLRWQADAASPAPEPFAATILQGESIGLECRLRGARIPISATASFLWQTNGMADAWWETNATVTASNGAVRADWTPAMDCGAEAYRFFLRVSAPGSSLYRAYGVLRMRHSPGATPNALPMPRPVLDFSAFEVLNPPWNDSPPEEEPTEYASSAYRYIDAERTVSPETVRTSAWLDAVETLTTEAGIQGVRLRAVSEEQGGMVSTPTALPGTWRIVNGSDYATLHGAVLTPTTATGPVTVDFTPDDGGEPLRVTVAMARATAGTTLRRPSGEAAGTWRKAQGDALAALFSAVPTNGSASVYHNVRGIETNATCRVLDAQQLYTTAAVGTPSTVNSGFFSEEIANALRCCSVGRTDCGSSGSRRPVMMVSPHYAVCCVHGAADGGTFCTDRSAPSFQALSFSRVADNGDLRLLRVRGSGAFPSALCPAFLRRSALLSKSASALACSIGLYQSQHGTVHPCLITPVDSGTWSTARPAGTLSGGANADYAALDVYGHDVHAGDSGHCVMAWINGHAVPVGLYYTAGGSPQPLMSDSVLDWLDGEIRRDSGGAEGLVFLAKEDLGE